MYYHNGSVHVEENDQCMTCKNFAEGVACPLLQALAMGFVQMEGTLHVTNCGFYEKFTRRLRLIRKEDFNSSDENSPKNQ